MKIVIDEQDENTRIDSYLSDMLKNISRTKIQNAIKHEQIFVNSASVKSSYILKPGDIIEFDDSVLFAANSAPLIEPEDISLEIVWEDENMAVVNKPSGMLTHPTVNEHTGTLVNVLKAHYGENLSDINGYMRRGIVHRLDRNTSGLIMIAKNNPAHEFLVNEMKEKKFNKYYRAIVKGIIEDNFLVINTPIGRHFSQPQKMMINGKDSKDSLTEVRVLERFKNATYVEIKLITGRTHQIRVHMSSIGHPVFNDTLYGFGKVKIKTEEQVLQAYKLEFTKPFTNERILLEIEPDWKIKRVLDYYGALK